MFVLRILSPALVLLGTISLPFFSPQASSSSSPSPITSVVVASRIPRRGAILLFLTLSSLTYLFDGLTFVAFAVLRKHWARDTGIEFNAIIGLVAFSGLAALGAWKDVQGSPVWLSKRVKSSVAASLVLDILLTVFVGLSISESGKGACLPFSWRQALIFDRRAYCYSSSDPSPHRVSHTAHLIPSSTARISSFTPHRVLLRGLQ